jgi:hypothetical protein
MRIDIDLDTNVWLAAPGLKYGIQEVAFKRDTSAVLEVRFQRAGVVVELAAGATGEFGIKADGEYDGDLLVSATSWTKVGTGTETVYQFAPALNSEALATALGHGNGDTSDDLASILAMAEVLWIVDSKKYRTQTVPARIGNDILKDEDETPLALPTPEEWLAERVLPPVLIRSIPPVDEVYFKGYSWDIDFSDVIIDTGGNALFELALSSSTLDFSGLAIVLALADWEDETIGETIAAAINADETISADFVAVGTNNLLTVQFKETAGSNPGMAVFQLSAAAGDGAVAFDGGPYEYTPTTQDQIAEVVGTSALKIGAECRVGSASPYRWFKAAKIEPTIWEEITPSLIRNRDTGNMERLFIEDGIIQTEVVTP